MKKIFLLLVFVSLSSPAYIGPFPPGSGGGGGGTGTVTSVGLSDGSSTPIYTISGSPVTTSGTLTFTLSTQTANKVLASATSGGAAQPTFRALVAADIPSLPYDSAPTFSTITTNTTLACNSYNFVSTASARSETLPTPVPGCRIQIKDKTCTANTNNITIVRAGSEKIETIAASYIISANCEAIFLVSDGTDWFIF